MLNKKPLGSTWWNKFNRTAVQWLKRTIENNRLAVLKEHGSMFKKVFFGNLVLVKVVLIHSIHLDF